MRRSRDRLVTSAADPAAAFATSAATATAAESTAPAPRTIFLGTRDVDSEGAATQFLAVEQLDGLVGFIGAGHLYERESAGLARELVLDDIGGTDGARLGEQVGQIVLRCVERQIADI